MVLGTLNHLSLMVSDRTQSDPFYDRVLSFLGYQRMEQTPDFTLWWSPHAGAITLTDAGEAGSRTGDRPPLGLSHVAFNADSREQVEALHQILQDLGATILAPPATHDEYAPGYYAVFFADPDGIPLELVHMPTLP